VDVFGCGGSVGIVRSRTEAMGLVHIRLNPLEAMSVVVPTIPQLPVRCAQLRIGVRSI
jgi:hypothetical protein